MHSPVIYQVRCSSLPRLCSVYGHRHLAGHRDWKGWTHHTLKDGKESDRYASPRLFSQKIIWIKKWGENWGCLETRDVRTSSLNSHADNRQVKVDALLGHRTLQTHFPSVTETLRMAERCKFPSFHPNSVWSSVTRLAAIWSWGFGIPSLSPEAISSAFK